MPERRKVIILGAGPTGLGTALGLNLHGFEGGVTLLEKQSAVGGLAGSFQWNGHSIDYGPHRLSPNIPSIRILAEELLGPDLLHEKSQHGVRLNGKCYQFPPRVVDWVTPKSLWLLLSLGFSFLFGKARWVTQRFKENTFESLMCAKFGKKFYKMIAAPMTRKVWTEPDDVDPTFVDQRFAQVQPFEVLKKVILPNQSLNPHLLYYPRKGYQQIWEKIADYCMGDGIELLCGCSPTQIEVVKNRVVKVTYKSPQGMRSIEAEDLTVVSTIPIASLIASLKGFKTDLLQLNLKEIKINSMSLAVFELDQPKTLAYRTLIFPQKDICFNRLFEQNLYSRETVKGNKSVIIADVTYPKNKFPYSSDAAFLERVKSDLKIVGISLDKIAGTFVKHIEYAYMVPDIVTRAMMYRIKFALKDISNLKVAGRFGAGEYDNSDYAIEDGLNIGAMISGRISKLDFLLRLHEKNSRTIVG